VVLLGNDFTEHKNEGNFTSLIRISDNANLCSMLNVNNELLSPRKHDPPIFVPSLCYARCCCQQETTFLSVPVAAGCRLFLLRK